MWLYLYVDKTGQGGPVSLILNYVPRPLWKHALKHSTHIILTYSPDNILPM